MSDVSRRNLLRLTGGAARYDARRPAGAVRAAGAAEVAEDGRFAQRFDLPTRSRASGHSYVPDMGMFTLDFPWKRAAAVVRGWARNLERLRRIKARTDPGHLFRGSYPI
jgi:FAD/FMN-containing dehydrogenase